MDFLASILILCIVAISSFSCINGESKSWFNVVDFGAVGNGQTDDSIAFSKAWKALCEAADTPTLHIPEGKTFLVRPIRFQGPCKSQNVKVQILGNIIAPKSIKAWGGCNSKCWLCFFHIRGLIIYGSGTIDGQGSVWWQSRRCSRPKALYFNNCNNFDLSGFTIRNTPKAHIFMSHCHVGSISNIHIDSPRESPNTDGISLSDTTQIHIRDSSIKSGDNCIAISGGCNNINITGIACGPGHGISVGSLGGKGAEDRVEDVHVRNCSLTGTQNGARIKTFQGGSGYARRISFEDINLISCKNPIIINQRYYGVYASKRSVKVSDVTFTSIRGTSANEQAITLDCSSMTHCFNIVMKNINITSSKPGKETRAYCRNAHGNSSSTTPQVHCLSNS